MAHEYAVSSLGHPNSTDSYVRVMRVNLTMIVAVNATSRDTLPAPATSNRFRIASLSPPGLL